MRVNPKVGGRIPKHMTMWVNISFLSVLQTFCKVIIKGKRINRGAGYGLEIPCWYEFREDRFSCDWMRALMPNSDKK